MITDLRKFPGPWYGGKQHAAPHVWAALGDVSHFVEPFCGSCAVLLRRPHATNRTYYSETVNDASGLLVNFLRSLAYSPDKTADAASWYVAEADIMARQLACLRWAADGNLERLMADPHYHDPLIGGWWAHGTCSWIGSGYCAGDGPWIARADGRIMKQPKSGGVDRKRAFLGNNGRGVNHAGTREPGVARQRPHLGNNGQGVNHAGTREPGVARTLPHLADNGRGVNRPQVREPGVALGAGDNWQDDGAYADAPFHIPDDLVFHDRVMPELRRWFAFLSARLRHVRIVNGDWKRVCTTGALFTLPVRQGDGVSGVFLDPPYSAEAGRRMGLYEQDNSSVAHDVRAWCLKNGDDKRLRIVLAGYDTEHQDLEAHGWRVVEWFQDGWLRGGMGNQNANGHQQHRERLWCSPSCLPVATLPMDSLWSDDDNE